MEESRSHDSDTIQKRSISGSKDAGFSPMFVTIPAKDHSEPQLIRLDSFGRPMKTKDKNRSKGGKKGAKDV